MTKSQLVTQSILLQVVLVLMVISLRWLAQKLIVNHLRIPYLRLLWDLLRQEQTIVLLVTVECVEFASEAEQYDQEATAVLRAKTDPDLVEEGAVLGVGQLEQEAVADRLSGIEPGLLKPTDAEQDEQTKKCCVRM